MVAVDIKIEKWKYRAPFEIAREILTEDQVVVVTLTEAGLVGRGEGIPVGYAGESAASVVAQLEAIKHKICDGIKVADVQAMLPHGAARNALDCALWDLESKRSSTAVWQLAKLDAWRPLDVTYTLGIDTPENMALSAQEKALPLYKVKLKGDGTDMARLEAINKAVPNSRLIVDANEGWSFEQLKQYVQEMLPLGVELIEQPLMAGSDGALAEFDSPIPLCADESCTDVASLEHLIGRYDFINIKLDKTGGLTEALKLAKAAQRLNIRLMVGCMAGTSLSMAASSIVGQLCEFVDLDGPLLYANDRSPGVAYQNGVMFLPDAGMWGE